MASWLPKIILHMPCCAGLSVLTSCVAAQHSGSTRPLLAFQTTMLSAAGHTLKG